MKPIGGGVERVFGYMDGSVGSGADGRGDPCLA